MRTVKANELKNGVLWPDTNGKHINAHGGGLLFHDGTYYWYGEHKTSGPSGNTALKGVHVYSSQNLVSWDDRGIALNVSDDPSSDIRKGCILERPKVLFNKKTGKFVMWFHLELFGAGYTAARCGVAVSDTATGPFTYIRSERPDAGCVPEAVYFSSRTDAEFPDGGEDAFLKRDLDGGQMARDMTLFLDEDGSAYHIFASEENTTLHISKLSDDFLEHSGRYIRVFPGRSNEAPAICRKDGMYWMITSGCTGWAPNPARAAAAPSIWGPWKELPNPCEGINPLNGLGPEKTFGAQSTFIFDAGDAKIAMFDIWNPSNPIDGTYVWLPVDFSAENPIIRWKDFFSPASLR